MWCSSRELTEGGQCYWPCHSCPWSLHLWCHSHVFGTSFSAQPRVAGAKAWRDSIFHCTTNPNEYQQSRCVLFFVAKKKMNQFLCGIHCIQTLPVNAISSSNDSRCQASSNLWHSRRQIVWDVTSWVFLEEGRKVFRTLVYQVLLALVVLHHTPRRFPRECGREGDEWPHPHNWCRHSFVHVTFKFLCWKTSQSHETLTGKFATYDINGVSGYF